LALALWFLTFFVVYLVIFVTDKPTDNALAQPEPERDGLFHWRNLGDGKPVQVRECPMCGIAPASVDDCGRFGDPVCPYFGVGEPEPEGVTDEQWDAIKERLWDKYETVGHQGERFMYQGDFDTALDVARKDLTRYARPAIKPVPVAERLPGPDDCAPWPGEPDATHWAWAGKCVDGGWEWVQISMQGLGSDSLRIIAGGGWTHWLPHHALPVPQP
jgi:hypothetical protein